MSENDPRSAFTWRERALISEALAEELLKNPPPDVRLAIAERRIEALAATLRNIETCMARCIGPNSAMLYCIEQAAAALATVPSEPAPGAEEGA